MPMVALLHTSCSSSSYVQLCSVKALPTQADANDNLPFVDDNCIVTYNFSTNGGFITFKLYHQTDYNIVINMDPSFFLRNSEAFNFR